jgi:predicted amidophosphoribosyltransferase
MPGNTKLIQTGGISMFCSSCGRQLAVDEAFCASCGKGVQPEYTENVQSVPESMYGQS